MPGLKNLLDFSRKDFSKFLSSFDYVFADIDGTLVLGGSIIPGTDESISKLRRLGKKITFVTNNAMESATILEKKLKAFEATEEDIFSPASAIVEYLKKIDFKKSIFLIGSSYVRTTLLENGFKVESLEIEYIEETIASLKTHFTDVMKNEYDVGAVIVEFDPNLTLLKIHQASLLLNSRHDVLLLCGVSDDLIPMGENMHVLGPRFYMDAIEYCTKREKILLGKPGIEFGEALNRKFGVIDPKRVLFIGDSIPSDMNFATVSGYQKLLVLSGVTKQNVLQKWTFPKEVKPEYYLNSLEELNILFSRYNID